MNNMKKTLAILEILCPAFYKADDGKGNVDYNTPAGRLLFIPKPISRAYRNIWSQKGNDNEKLITFVFNVITSALLFPVAAVSWIISQFVFAMHYDHKQRRKGKKSHLMLAYTSMGILILSLIVMSIDYSINKESRYIDLTPKVFASFGTETESTPERIIVRKARLVDTESGHKQSSDSDDCISSTSVEPEPEITTAITTQEVIVNEEDGYSIRRKQR